jgi:hypothetical protein
VSRPPACLPASGTGTVHMAAEQEAGADRPRRPLSLNVRRLGEFGDLDGPRAVIEVRLMRASS